MTNSLVIDLFRGRCEELVQEGRVLTDLKNPGLKGRFREILVEQLLSPLLPPSVKVTSGTIIHWGEEKRKERSEDDIVLFDTGRAPLIKVGGGRDALIPIEGVRACIEVKSKLTKDDVIKAAKAAAELAKLSPEQAAPMGLIFAYGTDLPAHNCSETSRLLKVLEEIGYSPDPGQSTSPIQGICVAGEGFWFHSQHPTSKKEGWLYVSPDCSRELLAFVSVISNTLYGATGDRWGMGSYMLDVNWLQGPDPVKPRIVPS